MGTRAKQGKLAPGSALEPVYAPETMRTDLKILNTNIKSIEKMYIRGESGTEYELPTPLLALLKRAASLLANGSVFVIRPFDDYVTQQQAADFLASSKNVINKYVEEGKVLARLEGDKKLISLDHLIKYKDLKDRLDSLKYKNTSQEFKRFVLGRYGDDGFPVSEAEISELIAKYEACNK